MLKKNILLIISLVFISLLILPTGFAYFEENTTRFTFPPSLLRERSGRDLKYDPKIIYNSETSEYYVLYGEYYATGVIDYTLERYDSTWTLIQDYDKYWKAQTSGSPVFFHYRPHLCDMELDTQNNTLYVACSFFTQSQQTPAHNERRIWLWIFDYNLQLVLPNTSQCGGNHYPSGDPVYPSCKEIKVEDISALDYDKAFGGLSISNFGYASSGRDIYGTYIFAFENDDTTEWHVWYENPKYEFTEKILTQGGFLIPHPYGLHADVLQVFEVQAFQDAQDDGNAREYLLFTANVDDPEWLGHYYLFAYRYKQEFEDDWWNPFDDYYDWRKVIIDDEEVYSLSMVKEYIDNVWYFMYYPTTGAYKISSVTGDMVLVHKESINMPEDIGYASSPQAVGSVGGCKNHTLTKPWIALEYRHSGGMGYGGRWGYEIWYPENTSCSGVGKHCGMVFTFTSGTLIPYPPHCRKVTGNASQFWDSPNPMFYSWCVNCGGGCTQGGELKKWAWHPVIEDANLHIMQNNFWFVFTAPLGEDIICEGECGSCWNGDYKLFVGLQNITCECTPWVKGECYGGQYRRYRRACTKILGVPCDDEEKFEEDATCIVECPPEWKCFDPDYLCWYTEDCEFDLEICYECIYGCNFTQPNNCYGAPVTTTTLGYCPDPCPEYQSQMPPPDCSCYCVNTCLSFLPDSCDCAPLTINTSEWRENPVQVFADFSEGIMVLVGVIALPLAIILLALGFASIIYMIMSRAVPKIGG